MKYQPVDVCCKEIEFEIVEGVIKSVVFEKGCSGNLRGICALIEGLPADQVADKLSGIQCGERYTSCPDQLSRAIKMFTANDEK